MVNLVPPEFVSVTVCIWLAPTAMLPKFTAEGLGVIWPLPANALEARKRMAEKRDSKRNPDRISLQQGEELFTVQPHVPRESCAEGDKKPQPRCAAALPGVAALSSVRGITRTRQIPEGHYGSRNGSQQDLYL